MKVVDLDKYYDKLQLEYGEPSLSSIYNGGCESSPDICFIFMNPTGRNVASIKSWKLRRYPWVGTKNIWKLFYNVGLIDTTLYESIQSKKPNDWNEEFAEEVYKNVEDKKFYITNLGKCTQVDARPLPDKVLKQYLELLYEEISIINPKKIVVFGNQVSTIFLGEKIFVSNSRKKRYNLKIKDKEYPVYSVYYPVGNGMRNIDKAIEDIKYIINE